MRKYIRALPVMCAIILAFVFITGRARASTTVSTDITTGGALNVSGATALATTTMTNLTVTYGLATSTFANGIDLTGGCFEVGGSCLSSGAGAATPGGSPSDVQYNNAGSLGGNGNFTYDGNTVTAANLTIDGAATLNGTLSAVVIPQLGTQAQLATVVPATGSAMYATDTKNYYIGDGTHAPNTGLAIINPFTFGVGGGNVITIASGTANRIQGGNTSSGLTVMATQGPAVLRTSNTHGVTVDPSLGFVYGDDHDNVGDQSYVCWMLGTSAQNTFPGPGFSFQDDCSSAGGAGEFLGYAFDHEGTGDGLDSDAQGNWTLHGDLVITKADVNDGANGLGKLTTNTLYGAGTAPTASLSTGAGSGSPVKNITGSDLAINFNLTTGTSPSTSAIIATITLTNACPNAPVPVISNANANAEALASAAQIFASSTGAGTYVIRSGATALTGATNYIWNISTNCY